MTMLGRFGTGLIVSYALGVGGAEAQDAGSSALSLSVTYKADVASVLEEPALLLD